MRVVQKNVVVKSMHAYYYRTHFLRVRIRKNVSVFKLLSCVNNNKNNVFDFFLQYLIYLFI